MKKILVSLLMWLWCASAMAGSIDHVIFLGDSLSDNGNLYHYMRGVMPKSPPYFKGRFSNGPTWAEHVGKKIYDQYYSDYQIYAVAGATTVFHKPTKEFMEPITLDMELREYYRDSRSTDRSKTLAAIWIGGNDYLFDNKTDVEEATGNVVNKIASSIADLEDKGVRQFLILNLPDLSRIPYATEKNNFQRFHDLTVRHNQKLDEAVRKLKATYPTSSFTYIDIFDIFNTFIDNPSVFNNLYHVNVINTKEACWNGDITVEDNKLRRYLDNTLLEPKDDDRFGRVEVSALRDMVMASPSLTEAALVGAKYEGGAMPCTNANEHLFWDHIHPSAVVHQVLGQIVMEQLASQSLVAIKK